MHLTNSTAISFFLALLIFSWHTEPSAAPKFKLKGTWKLVKRKKNIRIYQMKIRGSRLLAIRGDVIFNAPITKIMTLLANERDKLKWIPRLKEVRILTHKSPLHYTTYTRFKLPWPVTSRDFVTEVIIKVFPKKRQIIRYRYSVKHPKAPPRKGVVRAEMHYSRYILTSLDGGKRTRMRAEGYGDPKGAVPTFVVNMLQRRWPLKSIKGMNRQLRSRNVPHHPYFVKALKRKK